MRILAADDERPALELLTDTLRKALPEAELFACTQPNEILKYAKQQFDIAFLGIQMTCANGLQLAKKLKSRQPHINIIFVTKHGEYAGEAMRMHASGYIIKPVTREKLQRELDDLRYPILTKQENKLLTVRCFGNFEVYAHNGDSVHFERSKAKECLAYLISRQGMECTVRELAGILFEDSPYDRKQANYIQKIISSMIRSLEKVNAAQVIERKYNAISVVPERIDCDYFRFCRGDATVISKYRGEFMAQYSWAEFMSAYIERKL